MPQLIIIHGPDQLWKNDFSESSTGTLASAGLASLSIDTIIYSLPPSVLRRCNEENDWTGVNGPELYRNALSCLKALAENGTSVIFDAVITKKERGDELLSALARFNQFYIELTCDWNEIERRTLKRGDRTIAEAERSFHSSKPIQANHAASFDTTAGNFEDIADQAMMRISNCPSKRGP